MDLESPFPKKVIIVRLGKEEYIEKVISVKDQGDVLEVIKSSGTLALVSKNQVRGVLSTRPEKLEEKDVVEAKAVVARLHKAQAELPNESACSNEEIEKWEKEIARLDARMQALSTEGSQLESQINANPTPQEIASLGKRLKAINEELQTLEDQWLGATAALETAQAPG